MSTDLLERNPLKVKAILSSRFSQAYRKAPFNKYVEARRSGSGWVLTLPALFIE